MREPLVTVIIPLHNCANYIEDCLHSVLSQSYHRLEIIVIENCSTDDSLQRALSINDPRLHIVQSCRPSAAAARNYGLKLANGELVQFLDADDILAIDKIELQVKIWIDVCQKANVLLFGPWEGFDGRISKINDIICHDYDVPIEILVDFQLYDAFLIINCFLIPRILIDKAGLWNEDLSSNDDGEFFCRLYKVAERLVFCTNAWAYYRMSPNSLSQILTSKAMKSRMDAVLLMAEMILQSQINLVKKETAIYNLITRELFIAYPYFREQRRRGEIYLLNHCPNMQLHYPRYYWKSWIYYWLVKIGLIKSTKEL